MGIKIKGIGITNEVPDKAGVNAEKARTFLNRTAEVANVLSQTDLDLINNIDNLLIDLRNMQDLD